METSLPDDSQAIDVLRSAWHLMRWLPLRSEDERERFLAALVEENPSRREAIERSLHVVEDPLATSEQRRQALTEAAGALALSRDTGSAATSAAPLWSHEGKFAQRLRELMERKCITQQELADRIGCSQPAISQLLSRKRRPRKETLLALATALAVAPQDLWADLEIVDALDAAEDFESDDYVMTEAEAAALREPPRLKPDALTPKSLPARRRR